MLHHFEPLDGHVSRNVALKPAARALGRRIGVAARATPSFDDEAVMELSVNLPNEFWSQGADGKDYAGKAGAIATTKDPRRAELSPPSPAPVQVVQPYQPTGKCP